jgi:acyl-CoA thioester hydrolase
MFSLVITPKFGDIDGLGHVNNTVIPGWFEQARNTIYRVFNPNFDFSCWNLILVRYEVDFVSQLYYDKDVEIRSFISAIGRSSFEVRQEAWQNGKVCSKGKTVLVHFDFKKQKSVPIPDDIRAFLEESLQPVDEFKAN